MKPIFAAVGLGCTFVISTAVLFLLARHHITVTSLSRNHVHGHGDDVGDGHGCDLGSESKSDEDSKGSNSSEFELNFPSNVEELKQIAGIMKQYKIEHSVYVLVLFCAAYIYKQTFAIPGSVFMNLLSGALFGLWRGFPLVCLLTGIGATNCYLLSKCFGKAIAMHYFPDKISSLQIKVKENEDGLFFFLVCLRVFPMSPNWFINMASPVLGIPIHYFFASVVLGLIPYNFICCQTGCLLSELSSLDQLFSISMIIKLITIAVFIALPGIIVRRLKSRKTKDKIY